MGLEKGQATSFVRLRCPIRYQWCALLDWDTSWDSSVPKSTAEWCGCCGHVERWRLVSRTFRPTRWKFVLELHQRCGGLLDVDRSRRWSKAHCQALLSAQRPTQRRA